MLIAIVLAQLYTLITEFDPLAFLSHGVQGIKPYVMLYFSLQTLTTLGLGDVTPINPFLRMLAAVEAVIGQFYLATVIARLVTLARRGSSERSL